MREAVVTVNDADLAAMGLDELVSLCRAAGLQEFEELACHGDGAVVQVEVATRLDEDRLATLEYVDRWEHVADVGDTHVYVIAFTTPALPEELGDHATELIGTCDPTLGEHGASMSLVGPQESISGTIEGYEAAGVSPDLRKLGSYAGRERALDELTDRQREVLRTAYDMGYYEVPRAVSTEAVAAELDLDPSTVAEHLQRAERNLLAYHLSHG